jgi:tetratricopeptide (TPR) repeat protein
MKRFLVIVLMLLGTLAAYSQNAKGLDVSKNPGNNITGKTYALIVGVSKYRNPAIPSLKYADKDALEFRNYLIASGIDSNNIALLLNEKATNSEILFSIDELTEKAKQGDKVFIYFSGHGDVESHVITNDGYLLPYDAPRTVYAISAINVNILQSYVSTLSAHGVQAIVITDACHSGNLAGGLDGLKNISQILKSQWKDEIKILSCQPGELSLESEKWGYGRGLFSYELVKGLAGDADRNKDGKVTMRELNLYLLEKVPEQAHPMMQNPVITGDMETVLSNINNSFLENYSGADEKILAAADTKGSEEGLLRNLPDSIKHFYEDFKNLLAGKDGIVLYEEGFKPNCIFTARDALNKTHKYIRVSGGNGETVNEELTDSLDHFYRECTKHYDSVIFYRYVSKGKIVGILLSDNNANNKSYIVSAYDYLMKIPETTETKLLKSIMRRNLAAKEINVIDDWIESVANDYVADLGPGDPICRMSKIEISNLLLIVGREKLYKMGMLPKVYYALASHNMVGKNEHKFSNYTPTGIALLDSVIQFDSNVAYVYNLKAYLAYRYSKNYDSAIFFAKKALTISPNLFNCYKIIAASTRNTDSSIFYLQELNNIIGKIPREEVVKSYKKRWAARLSDNAVHGFAQGFYSYPYQQICIIYTLQNETDLAKKYHDLGIAYADTLIGKKNAAFNFLSGAGDACYELKEYGKAIAFYLEAKAYNTENRIENMYNDYSICCCYALCGQKSNAIEYLSLSLQLGFTGYDRIEQDADLSVIRSTPEFKALMKKYFPDQYKE